MSTRLQKLMRRSDLLLIFLLFLTSFLLYSYLAPSEQKAQPGTAPQALVASEPVLPTEYTKFAVPEAGPPIRFLMLNVQNYFLQVDQPRSPHQKKIKSVQEREAVAEVIASARPELVGLVEMGGRAALQDLSARLTSRGLHYPYSLVLERWGEDRALAILSRYPIVKNFSIADFMLEGGTARCMLRGILDVLIHLPDGRYFRIMGAHLKSKRADDPIAADIQRNREARAVATHVMNATRSMPQMPILVYGDWNAGPDESSLAILTQGKTRSSALRRLVPRDDRGEGWTIYYENGNQYSAYDQIYVNSVLSRRMGRKAAMGIVSGEGAQKASDHRALWCEIR